MFEPRRKVPRVRIPVETDVWFRKRMVQGGAQKVAKVRPGGTTAGRSPLEERQQGLVIKELMIVIVALVISSGVIVGLLMTILSETGEDEGIFAGDTVVRQFSAAVIDQNNNPLPVGMMQAGLQEIAARHAEAKNLPADQVYAFAFRCGPPNQLQVLAPPGGIRGTGTNAAVANPLDVAGSAQLSQAVERLCRPTVRAAYGEIRIMAVIDSKDLVSEFSSVVIPKSAYIAEQVAGAGEPRPTPGGAGSTGGQATWLGIPPLPLPGL